MLRSAQMHKSILLFTVLSLLSPVAGAVDLEWSGLYRVEGYHIKKSELESGREKNYGLHHLILKPKIVAADDLVINARFDIFNTRRDSIYKGSQTGQIFGSGVGNGASTSAGDSNVMSSNEQPEGVSVTQLYLTYTQEFGALIVGRAPLQFGLGITHNAGNGLFDHWMDTRDLIGYKFMIGNLFLMPMYGKVNESEIHRNDDLSEFMIQAQYENPETDMEMGVFYQVRKGSEISSDAPTSPTDSMIGGVGATNDGEVNMNWLNVYALKDAPRYKAGLEASFQSGKTGAETADGRNVSLEGFAVAGEFEYRPAESRWKYGFKSGIATGDNPDTDDKFEGYLFDRNYDVAFLLFNHPLGQADFSRTYVIGGKANTDGVIRTTDTNTISNVTYASLTADYQWTDRTVLRSVLTTGWFGEAPAAGVASDSKSVGYELDISLRFNLKAGILWENQVGLLFPGKGFEAGGTYDAGFAYGFGSRAAVSF